MSVYIDYYSRTHSLYSYLNSMRKILRITSDFQRLLATGISGYAIVDTNTKRNVQIYDYVYLRWRSTQVNNITLKFNHCQTSSKSLRFKSWSHFSFQVCWIAEKKPIMLNPSAQRFSHGGVHSEMSRFE